MKKSISLLTILLLTFHSLPIVSNAAEMPEKTVTSTSEVIQESSESSIDSTSSNELSTDQTTEQSTETSTENVPQETAESSQAEQPTSQAQQEVTTSYQPEEQTETMNQTPQVVELETTIIERNVTTEEFVKSIGNEAREVASENDLFASVMIAQAILESGSGFSELSQAPNYNLFGIKGEYEGQSVSFSTLEDDGTGNLYTIQSSFRQYPSFKESFQDYSKLLKEGTTWNTNIYKGAWKSVAVTYQNATQSLTGVYATDTEYDAKLNGLIQTYGLTKYDFPESKIDQVKTEGFQTPLAKGTYTITSPFGPRDLPERDSDGVHYGLDFGAAEGTPIYAAKEGTVITATFLQGWGNVVMIQHNDRIATAYAHQSALAVVAGQHVAQGELIGFVGSTGNTTGAHLHFEVCKDSSFSSDKAIDPALVLSEF